MADRIPFEFVGTSCTALALDPDEFAGLTVPRITEEVLKMLREIAPQVNFFHDDVVLAAEQLAGVDNKAR